MAKQKKKGKDTSGKGLKAADLLKSFAWLKPLHVAAPVIETIKYNRDWWDLQDKRKPFYGSRPELAPIEANSDAWARAPILREMIAYRAALFWAEATGQNWTKYPFHTDTVAMFYERYRKAAYKDVKDEKGNVVKDENGNPVQESGLCTLEEAMQEQGINYMPFKSEYLSVVPLIAVVVRLYVHTYNSEGTDKVPLGMAAKSDHHTIIREHCEANWDLCRKYWVQLTHSKFPMSVFPLSVEGLAFMYLKIRKRYLKEHQQWCAVLSKLCENAKLKFDPKDFKIVEKKNASS